MYSLLIFAINEENAKEEEGGIKMTVSSAKLIALLGFSGNTIHNAMKCLQERGLLSYKFKRKGNIRYFEIILFNNFSDIGSNDN